MVRAWQNRYPPVFESEVQKIVHEVYGQVSATQIAHSEQLKKGFFSADVVEQMREPRGLTFALLGIMVPDAEIGGWADRVANQTAQGGEGAGGMSKHYNWGPESSPARHVRNLRHCG